MAVNKGAIIIYEHEKTFPELDNQRRYWGEAVNGGAVLYWGGTTVNTVGYTDEGTGTGYLGIIRCLRGSQRGILPALSVACYYLCQAV